MVLIWCLWHFWTNFPCTSFFLSFLLLADQFSRGALNIIFHAIFLKRFDSFTLLIFQGKVNLALSDIDFRVHSRFADPRNMLFHQGDLNYMLWATSTKLLQSIFNRMNIKITKSNIKFEFQSEVRLPAKCPKYDQIMSHKPFSWSFMVICYIIINSKKVKSNTKLGFQVKVRPIIGSTPTWYVTYLGLRKKIFFFLKQTC